MLFVLLFHQSIYVAQVASLLVVVESVADDEVVRYLHCRIFDVQVDLKFFGFEQKRADVYGLGIACSERVYHAFHCQTAFDNVFKDNHRPA